MFYAIFRWIGVITGYPFKWFFFKTKVFYEHGKYSQRSFGEGALVICNHFNPLDYVLNVFLFFPRKLNVVASEFAFMNPFFNFGMKFWGGIQANRITKSMSFVKESIKLIKKNQMVLIFPEGHNTDDGTIKPFYPSYILIALKSNAPIIPIITDGNYGLFKRTHVMIGEKIYLTDYLKDGKYTKSDIYQLNETIYKKMLELRERLEEEKSIRK